MIQSLLNKLEHWQVNAREGIVFLIGGAYGFDESLTQSSRQGVALRYDL